MNTRIHYHDPVDERVFTGLRADVARALLEYADRDWTALELTVHLREQSVLKASVGVVCPRLAELVRLGIATKCRKRPCQIGRSRKDTWRIADGAAEKISVEVVR